MVATTASINDVSKHSFDFIVIGGGTAGLCVAARLTEDPKVSVLVLEAGAAHLNDNDILRPGQLASHLGKAEYDWGFMTTPQEHCGGRTYPWSRGKGLGGSSAINFMAWTKPPRKDINDWEKLGNPGWNWDSYEKYSQKSERFVQPTSDKVKERLRSYAPWKVGLEGPVVVSYPMTYLEVEGMAHKTLLSMGIPPAHDLLGGDPSGCSIVPATIDPQSHTRSYSTTAYYIPNAGRPNLTVLVQAQVNKIVTDPISQAGNVTATGVEFTYGGETHVAQARREVILAAGALKSPQILELSGIGKREVLDKIGITTRVELPGVGENVQEHFVIPSVYELSDDISAETYDILRDPSLAEKHLALHAKGEGVLNMGTAGLSFMPLDMVSQRAQDIHAATRERVLKNSSSLPPGLLEQYKIQLERYERKAPATEILFFCGFYSPTKRPEPGKRYFSILAGLNHNISRGEIHAISSDPNVPPEMNPNYMKEQTDLDTAVEATKFARSIARRSPFKDVVVQEVAPGVEVQTDAEIAAYVKENIGTTFHTAGSLSMMPREKGGVVDPQLKVYGTSNIRVVDISIVPLHFASHPVATVYMIAEKAADIIKGEL